MRAKIDPNNTQPQSELSDEMEVMARKAQSKSMMPPVIPKVAVLQTLLSLISVPTTQVQLEIQGGAGGRVSGLVEFEFVCFDTMSIHFR